MSHDQNQTELGECHKSISSRSTKSLNIVSLMLCWFQVSLSILRLTWRKVKALNQISTITLNKIGPRKVNNKKWVCKVDEDTTF